MTATITMTTRMTGAMVIGPAPWSRPIAEVALD